MDHHHPIQFGAVTASGIAQLHERDDVPYSLVLIDPIPAHFDPETVHKPALSHMRVTVGAESTLPVSSDRSSAVGSGQDV